MRGGWKGPVLTDAQYWEKLKGLCAITPIGCWEYQRFRHEPPRNYGEMSFRGKRWRTHRLAYLLTKGPIQKGMVVMHSCDNPPCCNPDHLKLGTHLENMAECRAKDRYYYAKQTHCKHGHEFNEENTYYIPTPGEAQGLRKCKACQRRLHREMYHRDIERSRERRRRYRELKKARIANVPPQGPAHDAPR